ncbi:DNA sulfur modification protein DndB [Butyrivibrio sp.]|uniref:DNA sulfur modification protein DndB n=1 Tax=Butyrivibrio sp. TaxID=28121 RepID=UPI0025BFD045|nr:DNA sulfur modification protein DndB [Butyrivibrio sp.]MBE5838081.1 DNA sulfur modification protein DndB [Butyrivibrio sp.]
MKYSYRFPVVKGVQAGREYYIGMVPLKMLSRLFPIEEEYVPPEYRAQRRLNENRIPEIKKYILNNRDNYVFSALAASIDGDYKFESFSDDLGVLEVSMDARILINDGQHRKAAILAALEEFPNLGDETISVVFYADQGLARSQQMFTDLNKHAVKTTNSMAELYDSRDPMAVATRKIISEVPFFDAYVDKEKDMLGKFSSALFTLNNVYTANKRMLRRQECNEAFVEYCIQYWKKVSEHMIPWNDLISHQISKTELREKYIAAQAVVLQALGRVGAYFYENIESDLLDSYLVKLEEIDWKRSAKYWKQRVIKQNGRMINNETAIILAANVIKQQMSIPLSDDEKAIEKKSKV